MDGKGTITMFEDLPDCCLEAILRYCLNDPHTFFNAARVNSRLHQASVTGPVKTVLTASQPS